MTFEEEVEEEPELFEGEEGEEGVEGAEAAAEEAEDAGAAETIMIRDGLVTEGSATNVFVVDGDDVVVGERGPELAAEGLLPLTF